MPTQIKQPIVLDNGAVGSTGSSKVTNSISPAVGKLIQVFVFNKGPNNTLSHVPTLSGLGITWHQITTHQSSFSSGEWRMTEFVGVITAVTSGTITIDFSGQNQDGAICYAILQYPNNLKLDIANPQNSVLQTQNSENNSTVTSLSITMGGFANPNNGTVAAWSNDGQAVFLDGNGMTVLVNNSNGFGSIFVTWSPTNIAVPQADFTGNNSTGKVNLGSEMAFESNTGGYIV